MEERFEDMELQIPAAPSLTFGEAGEAEAVHPIVTVAEQPKVPEEIHLTPEEQQMVDAFAEQIDVTNTQAVMNYGAGTQKKMADFSEKAMNNVRTKDMGEVGDMITSLVTQLKNFDIDENNKGIKSLFKKGANRMETMKTQYAKVETNVTAISRELERHQVTLLKDIDCPNCGKGYVRITPARAGTTCWRTGRPITHSYWQRSTNHAHGIRI